MLIKNFVFPALASKVNTDFTAPQTVLVWFRQLVASFAVSFSRIIPPTSTEDIFFMGNKFKMFGVTTWWVLANNVVNYFIVGQGCNQPCISNTMNEERRRRQIFNGYTSIPVNILTALPKPATIFINYNPVNQDTYCVGS